jgi:hypothetical protein
VHINYRRGESRTSVSRDQPYYSRRHPYYKFLLKKELRRKVKVFLRNEEFELIPHKYPWSYWY